MSRKIQSEALKSEYMEIFKDGLSEGEGVGVGINFQQKIICHVAIHVDYFYLSIVCDKKWDENYYDSDEGKSHNHSFGIGRNRFKI